MKQLIVVRCLELYNTGSVLFIKDVFLGMCNCSLCGTSYAPDYSLASDVQYLLFTSICSSSAFASDSNAKAGLFCNI